MDAADLLAHDLLAALAVQIENANGHLRVDHRPDGLWIGNYNRHFFKWLNFRLFCNNDGVCLDCLDKVIPYHDPDLVDKVLAWVKRMKSV
jgi:hypothetical protein